MMNNKRGQGLSTNTIILLVLGIAILVVLILGFTMGWSRIAPWLSTDNVDTIVKQCQSACSSVDDYSYCTKTRTLKADDAELPDVTCDDLAETDEYKKYGIKACPGLIVCTDENTEDKE